MTDNSEWLELFKIQQLIYRYFDSVNRADLEMMRSLFADDAVWEIPLMGFREESADAFIEFFRESTSAAEFIVMTPHCPAISLLSEGSARATTTVHEFTRGTAAEDGSLGPEGAVVCLQDFGIYYDDISLIDDSWKFTHRVFVPIYLDLATVTGAVTADRASLLSSPTT